jgi:gamma-glutamylcyclotransferase (GGCT)/AIG2-like uncharacterized protein YtfP
MTTRLFSYGTLQDETVQVATFGRRLQGKADALPGYRVTTIVIENPDFIARSGTAHHRNLEHTGTAADLVAGTALEVTEQELEQADAYEAAAGYERVDVVLSSGSRAWVYLCRVRR